MPLSQCKSTRSRLAHAPGVDNIRPLYLYSIIRKAAEVPARHVLFHGIAVRSCWLNTWAEPPKEPQRTAAMQARPCQGPAPG